MNEIILVGQVFFIDVGVNNINTSIVYLKIKNDLTNEYNYVPVFFRNVNHNFILSLQDQFVAISGHIEYNLFNSVYADVIKVKKQT